MLGLCQGKKKFFLKVIPQTGSCIHYKTVCFFMKNINEDDTKTKANTIFARTVLPPPKIFEFRDFGHIFQY